MLMGDEMNCSKQLFTAAITAKWLLACALVALLGAATTCCVDAGTAGDIGLYNYNYSVDQFYSSAQGNVCHRLNQNGAYGPAGSETVTFVYSSAPRDLYLATGGNCNGNIYRIPANQGNYAFDSAKVFGSYYMR